MSEKNDLISVVVLVLYGEERCPGLGSAGLALGGVTLRGTQLGEESGSRRRPGASLVAVAWAISGAEGAGPPGGGTSPYQGGGRARPTLSGCVGSQALQSLVVSSGISPELCSCEGSLSLGVHRPRLRTWESTSSLIGRDVLVDYSRCISGLYDIIVVLTGIFEMY